MEKERNWMRRKLDSKVQRLPILVTWLLREVAKVWFSNASGNYATSF